MLPLSLYYTLKPLIPRPMQLALRRRIVRWKLPRVADRWPILESAGTPPPGWQGWPNGKQFAFVLSHDVDTKLGLSRCLQIAEVEERLGFRSCFYFVPKGRYAVPLDLLRHLVSRGFEVGVHGLYHDWETFTSRRTFDRRAPQINEYLRTWEAVGFRAASMIANLSWIQELDIEYDASTFDTDPFEPQPEGASTIFPFWVNGRGDRPGYVELPYTLPQDYTLFVLLGAKSTDLWRRKLAWIAAKGGLALMDVHPCYTDPTGMSRERESYPLGLYECFLRFVKQDHADRYWHVLPRELARFWREIYPTPPPRHVTSPVRLGVEQVGSKPIPSTLHPPPSTIAPPTTRGTWRAIHHPPSTILASRSTVHDPRTTVPPKIWIDLDNTPHVPFFRPIIQELEARGYSVLLTVRDAFQVCDLVDQMGLNCLKIGRHYGRHRLLKGFGICFRSLQLAPVVLREKPFLALSHGSRSQLLLARLLGTRSVVCYDYEYVSFPQFMRATWSIVPEYVARSIETPDHRGSLLSYPGLKEYVYARGFEPDPMLMPELGLDPTDVIVVVRPPAEEAHYHEHRSDVLFVAAMDYLCNLPNAPRIVLLPRNARQAAKMEREHPEWFECRKVIVPGHAIDGLSLVWNADLVVSGGGTMNREAAALGVPVYSIFCGRLGAVDRELSAQRRLTLIADPGELRDKLVVAKRPKTPSCSSDTDSTLHAIVDHIVRIAQGSADGPHCP